MKHMKKNGFTLIELLVSVALFSIVMVVALGSLVALSSAVRRAEALDTSTNNLAAALDSMSRAIRMGGRYHCGAGGVLTNPNDCPTLATAAPSFTFQDGNTPNHQITYCLSDGAVGSHTCNISTSCGAGLLCTVLRSKDGGPFSALTSTEVNVSTLAFMVAGSSSGDLIQPKVILLLVGTVSINKDTISNFKLQTSVTQYLYDQ
ncbi:MAG: type II secretion system protein [bacterium]